MVHETGQVSGSAICRRVPPATVDGYGDIGCAGGLLLFVILSHVCAAVSSGLLTALLWPGPFDWRAARAL